jgi:hypothetical protein
MIECKPQIYKITSSGNNVRLLRVRHIISVHTRSLCVIYMLHLCTSNLNVLHCNEKTPPRSPPPTNGIRLKSELRFLGHPSSACPPRHWMRTNYTHACANQAKRLINPRFSTLDLQHVVGSVDIDIWVI